MVKTKIRFQSIEFNLCSQYLTHGVLNTFFTEFEGNSAAFRRKFGGILADGLGGAAAPPQTPPARFKIGGRRPPKPPKLVRKSVPKPVRKPARKSTAEKRPFGLPNGEKNVLSIGKKG